MSKSQKALAEAVIHAFGGLTEINRATGIPISTIHNWKLLEKGIPSWRKDALIKAAKKAKIELPPQYLNGQSA